MPTRDAKAEWKGSLMEGSGKLTLGSGAFSGPYDWRARSGDGAGTNPEELVGAAHAGCFSMAFAHALTGAGHPPTSIDTTAKVHLEQVEGGFAIPKIELTTQATVPGIDEAKFQEIAAGAKAGCPVSKALAGVEITLTATLA